MTTTWVLPLNKTEVTAHLNQATGRYFAQGAITGQFDTLGEVEQAIWMTDGCAYVANRTEYRVAD